MDCSLDLLAEDAGEEKAPVGKKPRAEKRLPASKCNYTSVTLARRREKDARRSWKRRVNLHQITSRQRPAFPSTAAVDDTYIRRCDTKVRK
ncbi:hypothetical protein GUJ93_ZPchr0006g45693 [Zizania palustris]|uniref:Uncharacterized protein n=1 Tax=Zizania palustris TaxID=103762 RepID=A0A8J5SKE3_ZIZPA|nr:hypothetical protein GUJ93_ZPchr0006g45693 [Zizania palustris]